MKKHERDAEIWQGEGSREMTESTFMRVDDVAQVLMPALNVRLLTELPVRE